MDFINQMLILLLLLLNKNQRKILKGANQLEVLKMDIALVRLNILFTSSYAKGI